jgi:hypothetical protein
MKMQGARKIVQHEVNLPSSFLAVTEADGQERWLNTRRILSLRPADSGALIELDNGERLTVTQRAFDIADYLQRPAITVVIDEE